MVSAIATAAAANHKPRREVERARCVISVVSELLSPHATLLISSRDFHASAFRHLPTATLYRHQYHLPLSFARAASCLVWQHASQNNSTLASLAPHLILRTISSHANSGILKDSTVWRQIAALGARPNHLSCTYQAPCLFTTTTIKSPPEQGSNEAVHANAHCSSHAKVYKLQRIQTYRRMPRSVTAFHFSTSGAQPTFFHFGKPSEKCPVNMPHCLSRDAAIDDDEDFHLRRGVLASPHCYEVRGKAAPGPSTTSRICPNCKKRGDLPAKPEAYVHPTLRHFHHGGLGRFGSCTS